MTYYGEVTLECGCKLPAPARADESLPSSGTPADCPVHGETEVLKSWRVGR